jgi:hypothetical protein
MIWLFTALAILLFVVLAGRAHSRYLDRQEALLRSLSLGNSTIDENWEQVRTRGNNVDRYQLLLQTELTELERRRFERRLKEERSAIASKTLSTAPLQNAYFVVFAGRAHSRNLDPRWRSPSHNNNMVDENWEQQRLRSNKVRRYRQLLQTKLTELERRHVERRLDEDRSAIKSMTSSTAPPS